MPATQDLLYPNRDLTQSVDADDEAAELIAKLSEWEADLLWAALIQLKPELRD
jgi:hypothetical protein